MRLIVRLAPVIATCAVLASCQNGGSNSGNSPYVSNYGSDGGYHPYPGQPGTMQGSSYTPPPTSSAPPTYTAAPTPPPSDPYAFSAPSSSSSKPKTSSSAPKTSSSAPKSSTASASKPKPKTPAKKSGSYKVVSGDTLYGIARKRGSTVAKIKAANGLTTDLIRPGQALKIP